MNPTTRYYLTPATAAWRRAVLPDEIGGLHLP